MSDDRTQLERQMQRLELRPFTLDGFHRQRSRKQRNRRIGSAVVALVIAAVAIGGLLRAISSGQVPAEEPAPTPADLGIFEPVAGKIVYHADSSLWAVDPNAPSPLSTLVRLDLGGTADADRRFASFTIPLGWSSDGTKLLFLREDPTDQTFPYDRHLFILHADGTETQVTPEPVGGAAISLDGSRVVFAGDGDDDGLYVVDAEGGQPVRIANGEEPTISPDGTQIAYLGLPRSGCCVQTGREHVWVVNADGTDAHEILAGEPALAKGADSLTWSPADDRIAMDGIHESQEAIYTFAPDGSEFTMVIPNGANPYWSPDGSQIAYVVLGGSPGFSIADANGSNVRTFGFGNSGPWHPGTLKESAEAPASPSPSMSPQPSTSTASSSFISMIYGISIDHPSGWQTRPATEPWTGEPLDFDSPAADVIFDPALGEGLYMVVASQPYGGLSEDEWRDEAIDWLCTGEGMAFGSWTVDGANTFVIGCGSTASAALIFTDTRGYLIRLVASSDEPGLADTYDWDWHKVVLETVDLRPEEAGSPA